MASRAWGYRGPVPGTSRDPAPPPLDADEQRAWLAFLQAASRALDTLDRDLSDEDLSLADYEILAILSESPDRRLAMSDLARLALVSKSRLTYRVDRLEQAGLVDRVRCESDARRVWATLTPAGLRAVRQAWPVHLASVRRIVIDPLARRDLPSFSRSLERIVAAIDAETEAAASPPVPSST